MSDLREKKVDGWIVDLKESLRRLRVFAPQGHLVKGMGFQDTEKAIEAFESLESQTDVLDFIGDDVKHPRSQVDSWFDGEVPDEVKEHDLSKY